ARAGAVRVQAQREHLKLTPGERGEQLVRVAAFEVAVDSGIRFRAGRDRVLRKERDRERSVSDDEPVALRRAGDLERELRQVQRVQVEARRQAQASPLR